MREIEIYCGGISQDQENGAWGAILISGSHRKEICGVEKGSSQRMILLAVIKGLETIKIPRANAKIYVPLKLFVRCVEENWLENWQKNGWMTKEKTRVKNRDLWERLIAYFGRYNCQFFRPEEPLKVNKIEEAKRLARKVLQNKNLGEMGSAFSEKVGKKIPIFRVEIGVNVIFEKNFSWKKIKKELILAKNELVGDGLNIIFLNDEEKKVIGKKEGIEEKIQKYSEEILRNSNLWNAFVCRGCLRVEKGDKEGAKADFIRYLSLSKDCDQEQILKDREKIFSFFPELRGNFSKKSFTFSRILW